MTEAKHTELPWIIKAISTGCEIWDMAQRRLIATLDIETAVLSQANAELICRAVNSHDALVEALEVAEREICQLCKRLNPQHENCTSCDGMDDIKQALVKATAE